MTQLKVGIAGAGGIAVHHGIAWEANAQRGTIVAVADISRPRAQSLARRYGGGTARVYDGLDALLEDPEVEAVDICLPHHLHTQAIIAAARAGKAILCEKPLCTSLDDAAAIDRALRETGVTFVMAHNHLFQPSLIEARRLLTAGTFGRPYLLRSVEAFQNLAAFTGQTSTPLAEGESPWAWRSDPARMGGGEVLDTGWHATYRLLALAGDDPPVEVTAMMERFFLPGILSEDTGVLLVRFASGAIGEIITSWAFANVGAWQFEVMAEHGSIVGGKTSTVHQLHQWPAISELPNEPVHTFTAEVAHFLDVVQLGLPSLAPFAAGARVLQVIKAAYRSVEERRLIALPADPLAPGEPVDADATTVLDRA